MRIKYQLIPTCGGAARGQHLQQQRRQRQCSAPRCRSERIEPRRLVAFLAMVFGMFMAILDIQIVSASLTEIQAGLSASANEITWVQTAYLDRRGGDDPAVGISVARARHAHPVRHLGRRVSPRPA